METVFRYALKIDDFDYPRFGSVKIMQNADGYGTSGVCMSEMTFNIPASDYGFQDIPPSAKVNFHMVGAGNVPVTFSPTFYIYSRSKKSGVISFKCYDRMIYTEQTISMNENSFNGFAEDGLIESKWVVQHIASQCGFEGWNIAQTDLQLPAVYMPIEDVIGKNCHEILNSISEAWCGFFKVDNDNELLFIPFGVTYSRGNTAFKHTAVSEGGIKGPIQQVIMSNGTETFTAGNSGADIFNTLKISSKYASGDIAAQIMERVNNYIYESWECQKCILNDSSCGIEINASIEFADGSERIANHITKIPTAAGIFISCGSNDVTETEFDYTGSLSKEIEKRIADGEKLGNNTIITRYQGLIHTYEEKDKTRSSATSTIKKFGYSPATSGGVVIFDGALEDKAKPKIEVNADLNGFSTVYGDTVIQYELEWDGDNVTLKDPPKEE